MGLIEKRGTTDGTGPNYHCALTLWNENDGKEYNNMFGYTNWSGWRITSTNIDINSLKTSVSEGKALIAAAVTDKGVSTAADATFQTMATNIRNITTQSSISSSTLAVSSNKITVRSGYTLWSNMFVCITKVRVRASYYNSLDGFYYGTDFTMSFSQSGTTISIPEQSVYVGGGNYGYVSATEVVVYYVN